MTVQKKGPFRADQVGSLLRPEKLKQARKQFAAGEITKDALREVENQEISRIAAKQTELGLEAVTDGEFRRSWWHFDFLEGLDGVEGFTTGDESNFSKKTLAKGIKITGKLDFTDHPMLEDYRYIHNIAGETTAKMTIPSPSMLHLRGVIETEIYQDEARFFEDLGKAYQKAIRAFYDAGCRYLQLDDTAWGHLCSDELEQEINKTGTDNRSEIQTYYANTVNAALQDKPEDLIVTMHICRGNFKSTHFSSGGYERVAETLFTKMNVDGYFLEYDSDRSGGFEPLRYVNRSDLFIVLGLITSKHGSLEDEEVIKQRIQEAAQFVPLQQLCLSPQCGFASTEDGNLLSEADQWEKLKLVKRIAEQVW